jgi:CHAT domain-containing protein
VQAVLSSFGNVPAAAVQAVVQPDRVYWLISTPTQQKVVRVAVKLPELAAKIRAYREALTSASPDVKKLAGELYTMIFAPVDAELKGLRADQVLLSLDDLLRYVPFSALHDGTQWLVERYAFSMFRDTGDLPPQELATAAAAEWRVAGFGVTKAVGGLSALPMVANELGGIVRSDAADDGVLPGTVRLDERFDRGALASALGSDVDAIHIASHFVLSPQNRDGSYLLLGTGEKLALDAFRSEAGLRFAKADFLALSACDTALSGHDASGVEIDSMAEIAQDAGAPAVLASLWPVADASTPRLMIDFYRHRSADFRTKAQALRLAQIALIARGAAGQGPVGADVKPEERVTFDHPFFWAPFVLLGDSR